VEKETTMPSAAQASQTNRMQMIPPAEKFASRITQAICPRKPARQKHTPLLLQSRSGSSGLVAAKRPAFEFPVNLYLRALRIIQ
jgi:hypothetical protein